MKRGSEYKDYILYDVLGHVSGITAKAMFGGWAIYKDGVIVGIITDGVFYLKRADTEQADDDRIPFQYTNTHGTLVTMPYLSVSDDILENPDLIEEKVMHLYEAGIEKKKE
jgi:DNA transformation protein and related proteins